jgi:hypothetical protein
MWDGREGDLQSQAIDATLVHARAPAPPSTAQVAQIVAFESNVYATQIFNVKAHNLDHLGATGGSAFLSLQDFFIGINDTGFDNVVFTLFDAWQNLADSESVTDEMRASIARGETLFNTKVFSVSGVSSSCTTCHDSPNVGNLSVNLAFNTGVTDASPPVIKTTGLPVFTVQCTGTSGPLQGQVFNVTDLGRALITGKCADVGKMKVPILRGLAARAPYFHNGSAATLRELVKFYDKRFGIGLTDQERADLVAFLKAL